jgi:MFS family permease
MRFLHAGLHHDDARVARANSRSERRRDQALSVGESLPVRGVSRDRARGACGGRGTRDGTGPITQPRPQPWYRAIDARGWKTLAAANLGWLFDGYETYALILTVAVALHQFLAPAQYAQIPLYAGATIGITLFGWAIGGIAGGVLSDYFGRKRVMMFAILAYSLLTGLTAFSWSWISFAVLRLCVGLALGSEWGTGTAMMAEIWPDGARGKGAGLMQCGLGIGFFLASALWLVFAPHGPDAWRWMYVAGIVPALATLWIRRGIAEPERWKDADRARRAAVAAKAQGRTLSAADERLTRFTLAELFREPKYARLTIVALAMSLTTTVGWWGISTWVPPFVASLAAKQGLPPAQWAAIGGIAYNVGGILGYAAFGFFADAWGRRVTTMAYFALSLVLTPVLFLWPHPLSLVLVLCAVNAFFTNGQYTWMPVWLPEVYPTRMRATAISFAFNAPRFVACLGPVFAGALITRFGGYGIAATTIGSIYLLGLVAAPFFPETRGRPLPE